MRGSTKTYYTGLAGKKSQMPFQGKYHCTADLKFGFDQISKIVVHSTKAKQLIPNKINGGQPYSDTSPSVSVHWSFCTLVSNLKKNVDDEDVENVFEWVDNTVEHSLQFGDSFDGLQRSEDAEDTKRLDRAQVLTRRAAPVGQKIIFLWEKERTSSDLSFKKVWPLLCLAFSLLTF